ncbi:MAG TPA: sigma-70 family RNA polymerase sigma factor, partial [Symbiobacteriaceae bacterium]|nr:sigma-70 family RNA polymerase sigma factor [Symbiobacteriaceae bacterium]
IEAVDKYDPDRGVRFETFAIPWVRGSCLQGIRAQHWAPALRKRVKVLEKAFAALETKLGRDPSRDELAAALNVSLAELDQRIAETGTLSMLSLEESLTDANGEGVNLADRIADPNAEDPSLAPQEAERRERLGAAIDSLPEQERLVVALFYYEGLLAREISDLMGLSAARVSQIHSQAILRLRGKLSRMKDLMAS